MAKTAPKPKKDYKPATTPKAAVKQEKKEGKMHVAAIKKGLCSSKMGKKK